MNAREIAEKHRKRAQAALDIGRYPQAEREARAALGCDPRDDESLVLLSRALLNQERYADALEAARQAVALAPRRGYCHFLVGYTLQCVGRHGDAIASFEQSLALEPGLARYHVRLGLAYVETKRTADAVAECERALALAPRDTIVLECASRVFGAAGCLDRAEAAARELVRLDPESASSFGRLAWVLAERKAYVDAMAMARESIRLDPNNYAAWANLGYSAMEAGKTAEGEEATREALRLRPGLASATTNLVAMLRGRNAWREAALVLAESRARDPSNASLRTQLGEVRASFEAQERLRWSDRAVLSVLLAAAAVPLGVAYPEAALMVAVVTLALAWLLWKLK